MAWNDLASNQIPTFTDLQTSGFSLNAGQSAVTSNECVTKANALAKYNLSSTAMNAFASNQLVPKSSYASGAVTSYSYTVKLSETLGNVCTATPVTIYSESSTWSTFMGLYSDAGLTTYITGYYYIVQSINNDIYTIDYNAETTESTLGTDTTLDCSTLTNVTITACGTNADGSGTVTLYAYSSQAVDTNVTVQIRWNGDLFTQLTGNVVISSGQTIGSVTVSPAVTAEGYGSLEILSITPSNSSTQNYIEGSVSGGSCIA